MAKIDLNAGGNGSFAAAIHTKEQAIDWCWERNQRARAVGWNRWLYVREDNTAGRISWRIDGIDNFEAQDIWAMIEDRPYVAMNLTSQELWRQIGLNTWRIERGMSPDAYMLWNAEHRRNRRRDVVAAQTHQREAQPCQ